MCNDTFINIEHKCQHVNICSNGILFTLGYKMRRGAKDNSKSGKPAHFMTRWMKLGLQSFCPGKDWILLTARLTAGCSK